MRIRSNQRHSQEDSSRYTASFNTWTFFPSPELFGEASAPWKGFLGGKGDWPDHGCLWGGNGLFSKSLLSSPSVKIINYSWSSLFGFPLFVNRPIQKNLFVIPKSILAVLLWSLVDMYRTAKHLLWPGHISRGWAAVLIQRSYYHQGPCCGPPSATAPNYE